MQVLKDIDKQGKKYFGNTYTNTEIDTKLNEKSDNTNENWIAPTFQNSWVNYGSPFQTAGYYKKDNRVYLRGLVKNGTVGQSIFTLPVNYRPTATEIFSVNSIAAFGSVYIASNGQVLANNGNNGWFSLDGISFRID